MNKSVVISSYSLKLRGVYKALNETVKIYSDAVCFIISVVLEQYQSLQNMNNQQAMMYVERLIHGTSNRKSAYPSFDKRFYKFPSYYRRSAIADAIAYVKSYNELKEVQNDVYLNYKPDILPCFFRGNTFKPADGNRFYVKVYKNNDWIWFKVKADSSDLKYLYSRYTEEQLSAPRLMKRHHGWSLRFAVESKPVNKYLKDTEITKALGVDLGLNTDAVCSVVNMNGTVGEVEFINNPLQKDRLYHALNLISKSKKQGNYKTPRLYAYVRNYNRYIAIETARNIVNFANVNNSKVIVFENLNGIKPRGSKKQKIALWRKRDIQKRVEHMAGKFGIRVSYICPSNTSRLAFDGSGEIIRGIKAGFKNNQLCRFQNGKVYNCDLSASKNIAARYFIRVFQKTMKSSEWSDCQAKVPELSVRTHCTLSSLINLNAVAYNNIACC